MHIHVHHGTKSTLGPLVTRQERVLFVLFIVRSLLFSDLEARLLKQWWPQHWLQDQTQTSHSCGSFLRFLTLAETKKSVNPKTPQPELIETIFPAPCLAFPAFQVVFFTTSKSLEVTPVTSREARDPGDQPRNRRRRWSTDTLRDHRRVENWRGPLQSSSGTEGSPKWHLWTPSGLEPPWAYYLSAPPSWLQQYLSTQEIYWVEHVAQEIHPLKDI